MYKILHDFELRVEAAWSSETSVFNHDTTRRKKQENQEFISSPP
jgi:hypothetical protein